MRTIVAATVTLEDLKTYFKHGGETPLRDEHWRSRPTDDGGLIAESPTFEVEMHPKGASFYVSIEAYDDQSDSDEMVTNDPAKFIVDFLKAGTGSAGEEVFGKMAGLIRRSAAISPADLSGLLRYIAAEAMSGRMTKRACAAAVRRACAFTSLGEAPKVFRSAAALAARIAADLPAERESVELREMAQLQAKMREKGWRSKVYEGKHGLPEMEIDIAGVYRAKVEVDHIIWTYTFKLLGDPGVEDHGVTDDPIEEFKRFYRSEEVARCRSEQREKAEMRRDDETVVPKG